MLLMAHQFSSVVQIDKKIKFVIVFPSICHEMMGPNATILGV